MAATISMSSGNGNMLCASNNPSQPNFSASCITSYLNGNATGEVKIAYGNNNNIADYIGIGSTQYDPFNEGPLQYIGVIRNFSGYDDGDPSGGVLRCFNTATDPSTNCTAPASGHILGMPYLIQRLPVVSASAELATENSDGSPARAIPGALITTPGPGDSKSPVNYWNYGLNYYSASCAQTHEPNFYSQGQVVYVKQFNFGGTVGVQDSIVTDGFALGTPNHIERYYYVKGYGRVRESVSYQTAGSSAYDSDPSADLYATNIYHNFLQTLNQAEFNSGLLTTTCPQGSAVSIES